MKSEEFFKMLFLFPLYLDIAQVSSSHFAYHLFLGSHIWTKPKPPVMKGVMVVLFKVPLFITAPLFKVPLITQP